MKEPEKKRPNGCPPGEGQITPPHGGRIGNPPYVPTDQDRANVRAWAKVTSTEVIAAKLGISVRSLHNHFKEELRDGKFEAVAAVGGKLLAAALKGNLTAMIFYLRTQGKWNTRVEHTGADGGPIDHRVDISEALAKMTEEQLAAIEPLLEQLVSGAGRDFDFRDQLGFATGEGAPE